MTRTLLAALLALACASADADVLPRAPGDASPSTFTTKTLGEAASKIYDLGQPLDVRVRIVLPRDKRFPLEQLHAFLQQRGFGMVAETGVEDGNPVPGRPVTLVATRIAVVSPDELDGYMSGLGRILPKDVPVTWQFAPVQQPG